MITESELKKLPTALLVEDDADLGPIIRDALEGSYAVTLVGDGGSALDEARRGDYDVLVVDRRLPGIDGVGVVRTLRGEGMAVPVLMLTALGTVGDRVDGLDAGANDYLVKPFDFDELLARLRALLRVYPASSSSIMIGPWEFRPTTRSLHSPYTGRVSLTPKESALLELLAREPDRTFSRERILRTVFETGEKPGTVDTYVHYIRRKAEHDIIETVRGSGYRIGEP